MFRVLPAKTPNSKMPTEQSSNQNIQVFIRQRPLKDTEKRNKVELVAEQNTVKAPQKNYFFDNVFSDKATQLEVYNAVVHPLVEEVVEGYNCTVFAYGQTGTGKTHTMVGYRHDKNVSWEDDPASGIIPRSIDQLIDLLQDNSGEFSIRVSFLELYNEDAYDLLCPLSDNTKLRIYQDQERKGSVVISGLTEIPVTTKEEIYDVLEKGSIKRQTAPTLMNALSSRSHTIFSVTVHIKDITDEQEEIVKVGKLNLVDLAGSENVGRSGAVEDRARETSNINKSLLTLGRVITSLVDKNSHIPYRDSKLTRLLQDSLGGKTKTSIIATISPSFEDYDDTISTLDYAQRAKKITNKPQVNLTLKKGEVMGSYVKEIERLRRDLEAARDKKGLYVDAKNYNEMMAKLDDQEKSIEERQTEIDELNRKIKEWKDLEVQLNLTIDKNCQDMEELRSELENISEELKRNKISLARTRVQVEENRVVIEAHLAAEEKLLGEANEVKQVTEKCIDVNAKLFDKIHNLKNVEENNLVNVTNFMTKFNEHFELVRNFNSHIGQRSVQGLEAVRSLTQTHNIHAKCEEAKTLSGQFAESFAAYRSQVEESIENDKKNSGEFQVSMLQSLDALKGQMDEFQTSYKESSQMMLDQFKVIDKVLSHTISQRQKVEGIYLELETKLKKDTRNFQSTLQSLKTDITDILNSRDAYKQDFVGDIQQLKDFQKSVFEQLNEKIESLETKAAEHNEDADEAFKHVVYKCDVVSKDFGKRTEENVQILLSLDQEGQQQCQTVIDISTELQSNVSQQHEIISGHADAYGSKNQALVEDLKASVKSQLGECVAQTFGAREAHIDSFGDVVSTFIASSSTALQEVGQLTQDTQKSIEDQVEDVKNKVSQCVNTQASHIATCAESTAFFHQKYQPSTSSGMTPKRTDYSYPQKFTVTSPHQRIIERAISQNRISRVNFDDDLDEQEESHSENKSDINDRESGITSKVTSDIGSPKSDYSKENIAKNVEKIVTGLSSAKKLNNTKKFGKKAGRPLSESN